MKGALNFGFSERQSDPLWC